MESKSISLAQTTVAGEKWLWFNIFLNYLVFHIGDRLFLTVSTCLYFQRNHNE